MNIQIDVPTANAVIKRLRHEELDRDEQRRVHKFYVYLSLLSADESAPRVSRRAGEVVPLRPSPAVSKDSA